MKSTRIDLPGLDAFVVEGDPGDQYVMQISAGFVSPYVTLVASGVVEQCCENYPGDVQIIQPGDVGLSGGLYLPENPGKVTRTVKEGHYARYCISHPHRKTLAGSRVALKAGEVFTVPMGSTLFVGIGSALCSGKAMVAPAAVEAESQSCEVVALADLVAICFVRPA